MSGASYDEFCTAKLDYTYRAGHDCELDEINPILFGHQKAIVQWAVEGGRRAIFAAFGLGKTFMQLETLRLIMAKSGCERGLIIAPLGVRQEFKRDAETLGTSIRFVNRTADAQGPGMYITNYESVRDQKLDIDLFDVVSLDEAACLRSFGSKTFIEFLARFKNVPYKYVATATPSPNRYKELIHYAGFLGIMDTGSALTRFFQRDSTQANNLTLYPHKEDEFWLWLASWAVFVQRPSDLGFPDEGYIMPEIDIRWHELPVDHLKNIAVDKHTNQSLLFRDEALGVTGASAAKRDSLGARIARAAQIVAEDPGDHFVIWHDLEDERHAIKKVLPDAVEIFGALDIDERERRIIRFSDGEERILATKPILSGSGCNFQRHCHRSIFVGVGFKFADFIQAVHRIQRFGQLEPVRIDIIYTEHEKSIKSTLLRKWEQHRELTTTMSQIIRDHGLAHIRPEDIGGLSTDVVRVAQSGARWTMVNNDTVKECATIQDASIDLMVSSIPFGNQYGYVNSTADFGHNDDNGEFWKQMDFLWPNLLRILKPGRLFACHVKDRIEFGNVTGQGVPTVAPFHAEAIMAGIRHGFQFTGMITVTTDVVRENNQTYRLGYSENAKDATKMGVGCPEYVLLFRRPQTDMSKGYADRRVTHPKDEYTIARWQVDAHAFWPTSGDRLMSAEEMMAMPVSQRMREFREWSETNAYDYEAHVELGEALGDGLSKEFMMLAPASNHPHVWTDINRMITLNSDQRRRNVEMHVCLAEGSRVLTRFGGWKPIQDVEPGEMVLTHRGLWRAVVAKQYTGVRPVVTVDGNLTLTPDHKLWARTPKGTKRKASALKGDAGWVPASDMVGKFSNFQLPPIGPSSDLDHRDLWLLGRWLADGHIDNRNVVHVSVGAHKLEDFMDRAGDRAGNPRRTGENCWQVPLHDSDHILRDVIGRCGKLAAGKHVPADAFGWPAYQAQVLIEGYLSGDGHQVRPYCWSATSVSKELLLGLCALGLRAFGTVGSVKPGRTVNCQQEWILWLPVRQSGREHSVVAGDGAWRPVKKVVDAGEARTWNLRVAEDESFTAEGVVVKNCPLQIEIVDRLIERFSNKGELVFDPFAGIGTVPYRALKLGRRGAGVELNEAYWADAVRYCERAEAEADVPSLFDLLESEAQEVAL